MAMTFTFHESIDPNGTFDVMENNESSGTGGGISLPETRLLRDKLTVPHQRNLVKRSRIDGLLKKSIEYFPATLICGRAGTGKTALASSLAASTSNLAWYSIESSDADWPVFSCYLAASLAELGYGEPLGDGEFKTKKPGQEDLGKFLASRFSTSYGSHPGNKSLIVLDDIHHIFDAPWFGEFFNLLIYSLPSEARLILLCRSKPPGPLWRLRSKQMLNVLDERVIAFSSEETAELFRAMKVPVKKAREAHVRSFGRVSRLLQHIENNKS